MRERDPKDTFLIYAIALEHKKSGDHAAAIEWFQKVLANDPTYCVAYHMAGQTYEDANDMDAAKRSYRDGIAAAAKKGDQHAMGEMQAALDMIE
jgi:Tfp pilus assembly protein PilF